MVGMLLFVVIASVGFGAMVGQRPGASAVSRWWSRQARRIVRAIGRQLGQLISWAWRRYRQFIVGFGVGVVLTLWALGRLF